MAEPIKISRRTHEASLLLIEECGGDRGKACEEAAWKSMHAMELGLKVERQHWAAIAAYLQIIDSGVEFDIQD